MPAPTAEERARSRAESRRRARLAARGLSEEPESEDFATASEAPRQRSNFLKALFPPAPPLPNRPDPLAKFRRGGVLGPVRERLYLLGVNPLAWMLPSLVVFGGYFLGGFQAGGDLLAALLTFAPLILAGWIGWQRPGLYGATTAIVGFLLLLLVLAVDGATSGQATAGELGLVVLSYLPDALLRGLIGYVGGWYGGYLRRRQAQVSAQAGQASGRRRR